MPVEPDGVYLAADWATLGSPETYVGYARATGFASPGGIAPDRSTGLRRTGAARLNQWALVRRLDGRRPDRDAERARRPDRRTASTARDVNLVLGARTDGAPVRFRVLIDGTPPGGGHGLDVDEHGNGTVSEERLYQLVRQDGPIADRTFEITFLDAGAQAYVFTFG